MQGANTNPVLRQANVNIEKLIYDDFILTDNKQYAVSKIWYQKNESSQPHTLYVQPLKLKVYEVTKVGDIILLLSEEDGKLFENIDELSVDIAKSSGVTKKFAMKDVKYKTIVNEIEIELSPQKKTKINALRLKIINGSKGTKFYINDRDPKSIEDIKKLLVKDVEVKVILEIDTLIVDLKNNIIFTNIILKQALIKKMKPLKMELSEYSFIDSDNEQVKTSLPNVNKDVIINTQTEYLDQNTVNSEKSAKIVKKEEVKHRSSTQQKHKSNSSDSSENELNDASSESDEGSVDVENFLMAMKRNR
jgi:hypothetical protein